MAELSSSLQSLLEGQVDRIGAQIGADPNQTRSAINAALPTLLAALDDDRQRDGSGLRQALETDHDGSILDDLAGYLDGTAGLSPRTTNGAGILRHSLGDRQQDIAQALGAKSGLNAGSIGSLLALLAPIIMGMLGRKGRSGGSGGGFSFDDIGDLLNREKSDARSSNPDIGDILDKFSKGGKRGSAEGGIGDALDSFLGGDKNR
ncbi:MAG TPA: DUF937 domain-containing protein [Candidatus Limnocylindria bacterium]